MTEQFDGVEVTIGNAVATHSVIWLHGLGADGNDFVPVVAELEKLGVSNYRFIFPHAPMRAVTINGGMQMRAWYDITSLDFDQREQDAKGTEKSRTLVENLIKRENSRGINTDHIVLAGFSQGGAIALHTGTRHSQTLAGVMALSTYLPLAESLEAERTPANQNTAFFMAHGLQDDVIAIRYAQASKDILEKLNYKIQWQSYAMGHSLSIEEIQDIAKWLKSAIQA